jgi:hemerythrin
MSSIGKSQDNVVDHLLRVDHELVAWSDIYITGIELIDEQHKELVNLTNHLYRACLDGDGRLVFKEVMHRLVNYVKFHFGAEIKLLEKINFPDYHDHKKQHEDLVKDILDAISNYDDSDSKKFMPNVFVRTLKDWIFTHIAVSDKIYSTYVTEQKKKGLLNDQQIKDLMK